MFECQDKGDFLLQFSALLEEQERLNGKLLIIIDESQVLPIELFEEIRLLSNEAGERNLLSIFLIGQPELQAILAHPRLLPLRQRIGVRYHLYLLSSSEVAQYIAYRLHQAGAAHVDIFDSSAVEYIYRASQGNPRLINIICDNALISGFSQDVKRIDRQLTKECIEEVRLRDEEAFQVSENLEEEPKTKYPSLMILAATISIVTVVGVVSYFFLGSKFLSSLSL